MITTERRFWWSRWWQWFVIARLQWAAPWLWRLSWMSMELTCRQRPSRWLSQAPSTRWSTLSHRSEDFQLLHVHCDSILLYTRVANGSGERSSSLRDTVIVRNWTITTGSVVLRTFNPFTYALFLIVAKWIYQLKLQHHTGLTHHLIFLTLGHSGAQSWAPECPSVKNYRGGLDQQ